ncbi:MAG: AbrB/MazE/SpoVT family DNA-binding domain-containing protein [Nanoarchaeota archaeon]|nr:AbrB/MazE/SpoVT family DNA-binding domain-containing protein [Nanoarchaeota archaeon]
MKIETTKMSSRGQIVIPQNLREEINADEGTTFVVMVSGDTLILKKVEIPSKEKLIQQLKELAKEGNKKATAAGIKESDVVDIVHRFRKQKAHESNSRH